MNVDLGGLITDTTPDRRLELVDIQADPRIGNLRPAWLADDDQWRDQLQALPREDAVWLSEHWDIAGGPKPDLDRSWLTMETIGTSDRAFKVIFAVGVLLLFALAVLGAVAAVTQ